MSGPARGKHAARRQGRPHYGRRAGDRPRHRGPLPRGGCTGCGDSRRPLDSLLENNPGVLGVLADLSSSAAPAEAVERAAGHQSRGLRARRWIGYIRWGGWAARRMSEILPSTLAVIGPDSRPARSSCLTAGGRRSCRRRPDVLVQEPSALRNGGLCKTSGQTLPAVFQYCFCAVSGWAPISFRPIWS
jgi:hypothetical protein